LRLQKYLADAGIASRRKSEEMIASGRVKVNGRVMQTMGYIVQPGDRITCDGKAVSLSGEKLYFVYYKPRGVLSTVRDDRGRRTVMDDFGGMPRIFPVGRLDYDSEGLIIMTNDGGFANKLMHPRYRVSKRYRVTVRGELSQQALLQLKKGVMLEDGMATADSAALLGMDDGKSYLDITIHEGRNRIIRRMFEAVGYEVVRLKRTGYGLLDLKGLRAGKYRPLTAKEINALSGKKER
jgi:23S rRNA pseudouridine2605 synthase